MTMFTLAISCLTTSNLRWIMDLTFQVPMKYCSLQHQTLFPSPVTPTTGYCFCFGSVSSFFLELFLHKSPVAYWVATDLRSSSFIVLSFFLFLLFLGVLKTRRQEEKTSGLAFPSLVEHVLSELSIMTCPWVALHGMAHSCCTSLHSQHQFKKVPFPAKALQHLWFVDFLIMATLTGVSSL